MINTYKMVDIIGNKPIISIWERDTATGFERCIWDKTVDGFSCIDSYKEWTDMVAINEKPIVEFMNATRISRADAFLEMV